MLDLLSYNQIMKQLRYFFQDTKGFIEVPAQSRLSILAAYENPAIISQFIFSGINYPLPQTGQMHLDAELLKNPGLPGVFCITTSYRNEPFPVLGRHDKIFPLFEFASHGNSEKLKEIEAELLQHLGFSLPITCSYLEVCKRYGVEEIGSEQELRMQRDYGNVISLEHFPPQSRPFWNMSHDKNGLFNKVDVILYGMESISSAERAMHVKEMRDGFYNHANGQYAKLLFNAFGEERVTEELNAYLDLSFFPRYSGGIGITRLARAMTQAGLLKAKASLSIESVALQSN